MKRMNCPTQMDMVSARLIRFEFAVLVLCLLCGAISVTAATTTYHVSLLGRNMSDTPVIPVGILFVKTSGSLPGISFNVSCGHNSTNWGLTSFTAILLSSPECFNLVPNGTERAPKGMKLQSPDSFTLHVVQTDNTGEPGDGFLAIPDENLGKQYYIITYCTLGGICQFAVTAIADDTVVKITFPDNINTSVVCVDGVPLRGNPAPGTPVQFILDEFDVLHLESEQDLSGTHIRASDKVAVTVGTRGVPTKDGKFSEIAEQLPPVQRWGTEFVVVPNYLNEGGDVVKIVTKTDNTVIHILGFSPFVIPYAGDAVERRIDWQMHSTITASNPVLIVQVMNLNLYNSTTTTGSVAMVLVQHKGQWLDTDQFFHCMVTQSNNESFIAVVSDSDQYSSIIFSPSPAMSYSPWGTIDGTDFDAVIYKPANTETSVGGALASTYGFCDGKYAMLLGANWDWTNKPCVMTASTPGDDVDNDCDGQIDENNCTLADLETSFTSEQDSFGNMTFKTFVVRGAGHVDVTIATCDVATLTLKTTVGDGASLTLQISPTLISHQICISQCFPTNSSSNNVIDCTAGQQYYLEWYEDGVGLNHLFHTADTEYTWTITNVFGVNYDELIVSAYTGTAHFTVGLPEKDCGKILSGEADMAGVKFVIPVEDVDDGFRILLYTSDALASTIDVELNVAHTIGGISLGASQTFTISKSDITETTYSKIIVTAVGGEMSVYLIRSTVTSAFGLNILPVDILGPAYHLFQDSAIDITNNADRLCDVFAIERTTLSNNLTIPKEEFTELTVAEINSTNFDKGLVLADRPVAVFCGVFGENLVQMPPRETLGSEFYIPQLDLFSIKADAEINVVLTEDSTVLTIWGDYDQMDPIHFTGDVYRRAVEDNTKYRISASKSVQVHLQVRSTDGWASAVVIPPTSQYKSQHVVPWASFFTFEYSSAVDINGTNITSQVTSSALADDIATTFVYSEGPVFSLTVVSYLGSRKMFIPSDVWYEDLNEVCILTAGSPGDGEDNDCDGLIDEEHYSDSREPGTIDFDLDGALNEDCMAGATATVSVAQLYIPLEIVYCEPVSNSSNGSSNGGITITGTTAGTSNLTTAAVPNIPSNGSQPTFEPITSSSSTILIPTTTPAPGSTAAPVETCETDCVCPCGWVNPPQNYTAEELEAIIVEIQEKLRVSKAELSSTIRKKTSAPDDRTSAAAVGYIGLVSIIVTLTAVALLDITTLLRDLRTLRDNVRQVFQP